MVTAHEVLMLSLIFKQLNNIFVRVNLISLLFAPTNLIFEVH